MKLFVKDVASTLLAICLAVLLLEIVVDFYPNEFIAKYREWYNNRDNITILLIGNSHIQTNIKASVIGQNAYNMAIGGSDINNAIDIAREYIPQMKNVNTIIVNFDYMHVYDTGDTFETRQSDTCNKQIDNDWRDYMSYIHHRYLHSGSRCSRYNYALLCNQMHYTTLCNQKLTDLHLDKLKGDFTDNPCFSMGRSSMDLFNNQLNLLSTIAQITKEKQARLIVITSPANKSFCKQITQRNIVLMNNAMDSLSLIYPIEYKNYLLDTMFQKDELYMDIHHFNTQGSTLFTNQLKKDFRL